LFEVGLALVRTDDFRPNALSQFIVWGAVWYIHHRISQDPQQDSKRLRLYRASGSLVGLFTVALATAFVLTIALSAVYSSLFDTVAIDAGSERLREGLVGLTVGLLIWWRYWLSSYAHADRDVVWHGYGLLTGVLPGLITLLTGLTMLAFWILDWLRDSGGSAAEHFELTPNALAAIGVGTLLWAYHRAVLRTSAADERTEIDRVYDYLVSAVGLLAAASGVATVLVAVVQGLVPGDASGGAGDETSVLMGAIALLIVGLPVWWRSWSKIQRIRAAQPEAELVSASRRIYLFALFGVGGVAALISLLTLGVQVLEDLFSGRLGSETLFSIRISIALVITVGAIAAYHWIVRREDQDDMPAAEERLVLVRSIVLVSANGPDIASEIERRTGVRVRTWDRPDSDVDVATDDVVEAIEQGEHSRLLLIARPGQVEAIPYRELR